MCRGVPGERPQQRERIRAAEVAAALCLATDLGMGFPFEHGLHSTLTAMRLASASASTAKRRRRPTTRACSPTRAAPRMPRSPRRPSAARWRLTTPRSRSAPSASSSPGSSAHCRRREVRRPCARSRSRAGCQRRRGSEIPTWPRSARWRRCCPSGSGFRSRSGSCSSISPNAGTARDICVVPRARRSRWRSGSRRSPATPPCSACWAGMSSPSGSSASERAMHSIREVANCLADSAGEIFAHVHEAPAWDETLAREPRPALTLEGEAIDRALAAIGDFADLTSPYFAGHSAGVAELASAAAQRCGIDAAGVTTIRRAALVHDLGRVVVHPGIWQKPGPLTPDEWEQVRLHPYHTERVLSRSPFLSALAPVAGAHHERLDGSGYHRGSAGAELAFPARLLAAADVYHAMTEPRPHRDPVAARAGRRGARPGGERRPARRRRRRRGGRGGRPAGAATRAASRAHGARGRGRRHARARPADQAGRPRAWGSRSRPRTAISRTPIGRSASRPVRGRPCSRWSMAWPHGENSRLRAPARPLVASASTSRTRRRASRAKEDEMSARHDRGAAAHDLRDRGGDRARRGRRVAADLEDVSAPVRQWLLTELAPRPGDTVLELAAGVGDTGFEAAAIVGERGRLLSTDFSPAMVEAARRRGNELGVENVEYRVMDAERIELDADSVDGVLCRFGYMLMADPCRGARRDPPRPARGRAVGAGGLGRTGAQPVLRDDRDQPRPARPPADARAPGPAGLQHGERGAHDGAARGRRVRRGADGGGRGAVRASRTSTST